MTTATASLTTAHVGDVSTGGLLEGHSTAAAAVNYSWAPGRQSPVMTVSAAANHFYEELSRNSTVVGLTVYRASISSEMTPVPSPSASNEIVCGGSEHFGMTSTIVLSLLIGLVAIVTIAGNTLVIVAFGTDRKLRTFGNYFILNLAISDLIVGLLICIYAPLLLRGCWQLSRAGCLIWLLLDYVVPLASAWNMALISLDRYWSVARPIEYRLAMSSRRAVACMSVPWLAGIVWYGPSVLLWAPLTGGQSIVPDGKCFVEFINQAAYLITSSFVEFVAPFVTVATINILIYLNIRRRSRGLTSTAPVTHAVSGNVASNGGGSGSETATINNSDDQQRRAKAKRMLSRDKKSARSLAILIIVFLFTWAPFEICAFVNPVCNFCIDESANEVVFWLLWLNSTINPILYPLLQQRFRVAFRRLLCCFCDRHPVVTGGLSFGRSTIHSVSHQRRMTPTVANVRTAGMTCGDVDPSFMAVGAC
jgi:histamine receptor H3